MTVWRYAAATAIGTSHIGQGLPCQDYAKCIVTSDVENASVLLGVVSDGAGSAENSHIGSELACTLFIEEATAYLKTNPITSIDSAITQGWLGNIRDAINRQAIADQKRPRDYACTFLAAIIGEIQAAFIQIGDGAIVVSDIEESSWGWVFWPHKGEYANTTSFLTDENALGKVSFETTNAPIVEVALFTDGIELLVLDYATQTAFAPFYDKMFPAIRASTANGMDNGLSLSLEKYLASPLVCDRTDDDKSLILATRRANPLSAQEPDTSPNG